MRVNEFLKKEFSARSKMQSSIQILRTSDPLLAVSSQNQLRFSAFEPFSRNDFDA